MRLVERSEYLAKRVFEQSENRMKLVERRTSEIRALASECLSKAKTEQSEF
jgi:hypothetical protein